MKIVTGNELEDYYSQGLFDNLNSPREFMNLMFHRNENTLEFYLSGIQMLDDWYGDKAYRKYEVWFDILDQLMNKAENHFMGRFGKE